MRISQTIANVPSVGSAFNGTPEVKVLSLPETMNEKSTFRLNSWEVNGGALRKNMRAFNIKTRDKIKANQMNVNKTKS